MTCIKLTLNKKIQLSVLINTFLLMIFSTIIFTYADENTLKIGYNDSLFVLGVKINTFQKYIILHSCIFFLEFLFSLVYEYANPIMYFNVFNSDKVIITDFTKFELQIYSQSLWFLTSIKNTLMILVSISQIDIAIAKVIYAEIAVIFVIRNLLNDKQFTKNSHIKLIEDTNI